MKIEILSIHATTEPGSAELLMRFGDSEEKRFRASYSEIDGHDCGQIDHELFLRLSNLGIRNLSNSGYYHIEVGEIVKRFLKKEALPDFPIDIDRSCLHLPRPSIWKIAAWRWMRLRRGLNPFRDRIAPTNRHA